MIDIYLLTETKIGYIYFQYSTGKFENITKSFESKYSLKNYLIDIKITSLLVGLESFIQCFKDNEKIQNNLDQQCFSRLMEACEQVKGLTLPELKKLLTKRKPELGTLIKTAENKRTDLAMIYKKMFQIIEEKDEENT
jgi:hypothetical protein